MVFFFFYKNVMFSKPWNHIKTITDRNTAILENARNGYKISLFFLTRTNLLNNLNYFISMVCNSLIEKKTLELGSVVGRKKDISLLNKHGHVWGGFAMFEECARRP